MEIDLKLSSYTLACITDNLMWSNEITLLKQCVNSLKSNPIVVIIGAGAGVSSLALLEERSDIVIFSIDNVFPTTGRHGKGEKGHLVDAGYWDEGRVIQIIGESQTVGKHWPFEYDMIFIDGDHGYDAIKVDIELWIEYAKPGAYIALHDYADKSVKPLAGVKQAVDELISHYDFVGYERTLWVVKKPST